MPYTLLQYYMTNMFIIIIIIIIVDILEHNMCEFIYILINGASIDYKYMVDARQNVWKLT
jgi:hypothetical protein